ncbi:Uncharacterised protein [Streptococcus pneumoniae]|nr:Uncharacterised protein [Streptococcus pneumoniae]
MVRGALHLVEVVRAPLGRLRVHRDAHLGQLAREVGERLLGGRHVRARDAGGVVEVDREAVRVAGLGEQRLGLGGVVLVRGDVLAVPVHGLRDELGGGLRALGEGLRDEGVLVDRVGDRLAHPDVLELLLLLVQAQVEDGERVAGHHVEAGLGQRRGVRGGHEVVAVDVPGLERLTAGHRVVDHAEGDVRDLAALAPVVLVGGELDVLAHAPGLELVGAGAGGVCPGVLGHLGRLGGAADLVRLVLLERLRRLHGEGRQGQGGDEARERLRQRDLHLVLAGGLALLVDGVLGLVREAAEQLAVVVREGLRLLDAREVVPAVEVGAHGLPVERLAVVEGHALLQLERVGQAVLRGLPGLGQQRRGVRGARLRAHEALEDLTGDPERLAIARERRIEALGVGGGGEDERAVHLGGVAPARAAGAAAVALALGAAGDEQGAGRGERGGGQESVTQTGGHGGSSGRGLSRDAGARGPRRRV